MHLNSYAKRDLMFIFLKCELLIVFSVVFFFLISMVILQFHQRNNEVLTASKGFPG